MSLPRTPRTLPPPPQTQAHHCASFRPPPLDGTLTIAQMYDWHFRNTPHHRLFVYALEDGSTRTIYWPEAVKASYVGGRILRDRFGWFAGMNETPVVAILAASDTIPYFVLLMSCFRANYVPFPISPRNSPAAVAHLVSKVGVSHILTGNEPAMVTLAKDALKILMDQSLGRNLPDVSPVPLFEDLFLPSGHPVRAEDLPYEYKGPDVTAMILHSSGSTAFPKPIYWTNHRTIQGALIPWFGGRELTDQVFSLHGMPMYHGMGVLQTFWSASCGLVISAFEPKSPPIIPTPDGLFLAAKATSSDIIFCVPSFIEAWSREPEYVKWLATRGGVLYGGGSLNKQAGDYMTSQGVSIFILYGATEVGIMSPILPVEAGYDWDYFKFPELLIAEMVPYGNNTFELVLVSNVFCRPSVLNTQVNGIDAYATSDLLVPHPTKPGYWRVFGRTDDQIMHNTGEKTNPGPLENILNQDPHILASVMFGRGRFQAGVILDPRPEFRFDPLDLQKLADFRNLIWTTVEKANAFAPQHSRLFKEMILVAKPKKPFTYTAKMTARRQAIITEYEPEIAEIYDTVEETTQSNIPPPEEWDPEATLDFVRNIVRKVLVGSVQDNDDIFQYGCDSLQATWIRNSLLRALRDSAQLDTRRRTRNFVYDYPSISQLASFIFSMVSCETEGGTSASTKIKVMHDMVSEYTQNFKNHLGDKERPPSAAKVVLITGTTGELGCYLLSLLATDIAVTRIYALNRSSQRLQNVRKRQEIALTDRGLDTNILDTKKIVLIEGDLVASQFSLADAMYSEMQCVTHIIHNAWPVDFNLALKSFEPNVKGLRNLVDFSLRSPFLQPPRLIYTSSIGIFQNVNGEGARPESPIDAETARGTGYTESKWIAEQILVKTAELTPLKPLIVRVGQLCGGINGAWNTKEWAPALVQSAGVIGCIPEDHKEVSWIPVHVAAAAIIDFLTSDPSEIFLHLVHPRPVAWSTLGNALAAALSVPLVPYMQWLSLLEDVAQKQENTHSFRATRLLSFFRSLIPGIDDESQDAFGLPKLDMKHALEASVSLRSQNQQLGMNDVNRWLSYWRSVGLL
ncbi:hypothetical protein B0H10DRAFT_1775629 [Mycena sp. CBHHK59/15]|nr:hypothetical protein B0H10DRAFT_1775629 [Mycena sp. CBHHK59/15]